MRAFHICLSWRESQFGYPGGELRIQSHSPPIVPKIKKFRQLALLTDWLRIFGKIFFARMVTRLGNNLSKAGVSKPMASSCGGNFSVATFFPSHLQPKSQPCLTRRMTRSSPLQTSTMRAQRTAMALRTVSKGWLQVWVTFASAQSCMSTRRSDGRSNDDLPSPPHHTLTPTPRPF
jgi:hypothetical protein